MKKFGDMHKQLRIEIQSNPNTRFIAFSSGLENQITLLDPQLIMHFLQNEDQHYKKQSSQFLANPNGGGLVFTGGEEWKRQRAYISEMFHFKNLINLIPKIVEVSDDHISKLLQKNQLEQNDPIHVIRLCKYLAGESILKSFFGNSILEKQLNGQSVIDELQEITKLRAKVSFSFKYIILSKILGPRYNNNNFLMNKLELDVKKRWQGLGKLIISTIDEKIKEMKVKDCKQMQKTFLEMLVQLYLEEKIPKDEIIAQFFTFFIAGTDTTGVFTGMLLYALANYPEYQKKIFTEIQDCKDFDFTKEKIESLSVLSIFIKESFRFYTPAAQIVVRRAQADNKILDLEVKKNTQVSCGLLLNMRNPNYFKDPDHFNPERWNDQKQPDEHFTYIPFSAGKRNCIGQHLALLETKIFLIKILIQFQIIKAKDARMVFSPFYLAEEDDLVYFKKRQKDDK